MHLRPSPHPTCIAKRRELESLSLYLVATEITLTTWTRVCVRGKTIQLNNSTTWHDRSARGWTCSPLRSGASTPPCGTVRIFTPSWGATTSSSQSRRLQVRSRAVGKLFVVTAGALPVPVSDSYKSLYRAKSPKFLRPKPDLLPAKAVLLPSQAGSTTASHQPWSSESTLPEENCESSNAAEEQRRG
jgi:hypothetical protein